MLASGGEEGTVRLWDTETGATLAVLHGHTAFITGASSGIGKACAFEFAKTSPESLKLILTARRLDTLKEIAAEINQFAPKVQVLPLQLDVSVPEEVSGFVGRLGEEWREVDVLVNNAYAPPFFLERYDIDLCV